MTGIAKFDELFELLDAKNGDKRWKALQKWLKENKVAKAHVAKCLALSPPDAVNYLAAQFSIPASTIRVLVPNHPMILKPDDAMKTIQELYRERSAADAKPKRLKKVGTVEKPTE